TAAPRVLDIAERTHSRIALPSGGVQHNDRYERPADFQPLPSDPDPLERSTPALEMTDPSPAQIRRAVTSIGHGQISAPVPRDLEIGVSEAVVNAWQHGRPPVTARIWTTAGRFLVRVHDTGPGPADVAAGLVPVWADQKFRQGGLWLIHMLDLDTALIRSAD